MRLLSRRSAAALIWAGSGGLTFAQDEKQAPIPFEDGTLTITENEDFEKILAFDGKELARNYFVDFDKIVELDDVKVALFSVADGGNACGPAAVMVWKPKDSDIQSISVGEDDCGAPPAVTYNSIFFVPYPLPGETLPVRVWSPVSGLSIHGELHFMPQPGTKWTDVDPAKYQNIIEAFRNEAVYKAAEQLLDDKMTSVAASLLTGGGTESMASGAFYGSGCVPHACGSADGFMAVDPKAEKLYFAQEGDKPEPDTWPPVGEWPAEIREAMKNSFNPPQ
jgi:hypothetical protein